MCKRIKLLKILISWILSWTVLILENYGKIPFFSLRALSPPSYSSFVNSTKTLSEYPEVGQDCWYPRIPCFCGYLSAPSLSRPPSLSGTKAQPPYRHCTPVLHHPLQNCCSWITPTLPHRVCTTAPGWDPNLWCLWRELWAAGCWGQVPHCVCQAVCPLPCCISAFLDDGQEAGQELPEISTLASTAQLHLMGCWMGIGRLASTRTPHHPQHHPEPNREIKCDSSVSLQPWCPHAWLKGMFLFQAFQIGWHKIDWGCGHGNREAKLKA